MSINTEQWQAEIGSFNDCSQHLIVKLLLNLLNLLFSMFLVSFFIIAITVCYITKPQIFLYLTTLFLCDFLAFLSTSTSYSNFSHLSKFIFIKRSFTNVLYITSFINVAYSTYFLHILLLQHGDTETNPGPQKEKTKNISCCHWNVNSLIAHNLSKLAQPEACNSVYKHDFICISEMFFDPSIQEGDKNIQLDGYNLFRVDHPSNSKRGGVCIFYKEKVSIQNSKGYVGIVY